MDTGKDKKEKRLRAAALRYKHGKERVPRMVAKGQGLIAEKIIAVAKEHGIPITRDPDLVTILSKLDLEQSIDPSLFEVVAELLVFVYRLKEKAMEEGMVLQDDNPDADAEATDDHSIKPVQTHQPVPLRFRLPSLEKKDV